MNFKILERFTLVKLEEVLDLAKFSLFPCMNYFLILVSIEALSYFLLMKSEIEFTVMCAYYNIFSIQSCIIESISNAMTILMSYAISQGMKKECKKLLRITMLISIIICFATTLVFALFDNKVFLIFSEDNEFIQIALDNSKYFSITLF
jgi:Na+-driven multidrug efflux pump